MSTARMQPLAIVRDWPAPWVRAATRQRIFAEDGAVRV